MRKFATLFLVVAVYALMGISAAAADNASGNGQQNPDSIVTCSGEAGDFVVINRTTPTFLALDECSAGREDPLVRDPCAPCIRSLENQGCMVVDVIVTNGATAPPVRPGDVSPEDPRATFLLSCAKP